MAHLSLYCLLSVSLLHLVRSQFKAYILIFSLMWVYSIDICLLGSVLFIISKKRNSEITYGFSVLEQVASSGVFELKVHSFSTTRRYCRRTRDCNIFFRICLKHSEDVISAEPPCTFGTGQTNVLRADQSSISNSAAIRVPFHFKWPVNFITH